MATRFYFSRTQYPGFDPTPDAGWTRASDADTRLMDTMKDGSTLTNKTAWAATNPAANATACFRIYVSPPIKVGTQFTTSHTLKGQVRCLESATNDNINRTHCAVKVCDANGGIQATLLALGAYGSSTTEWPTTLTNRRFFNGTALTSNYTTVAGDRLLLELGGQISGTAGTSVTGSMNCGSSGATDLAEDDTSTAANSPWFEISLNLELDAVEDLTVRKSNFNSLLRM